MLHDKVFGCGGCGEVLASAFEEHFGAEAHLFNFSKDSAFTRRAPFIDLGGTGRRPELGEIYYKNHRLRFQDYINSILTDGERLLVIAGLGGGAGSGILKPLLEDLFPFKFHYLHIIGVIPENDVELRKRALYDIKYLRGVIKKAEFPIVVYLADNEYIKKRLGLTISATYQKVNEEIMRPFHYYKQLSSEKTGWARSWKKLDLKDVETFMSVRGFADFREFKFYETELKSYSLFCKHHDLKKCKSYLLGITENGFNERIDAVIKVIDRSYRNVPNVKTANFSSNNDFNALMLCTGMPLSKKIQQVVSKVISEYKRIENKTQDATDAELNFDGMDNFTIFS